MTYYTDMILKGGNYATFIYKWLKERKNISVKNYDTKEEQFNIGENDKGIEIKYDDWFARTGNLWIEIKERTKTNKEYVFSGIYRNDNTRFYLIGDYRKAYVFVKKQLQDIQQNYKLRENNMKTSWGYLLPEKDAIKYAYAILVFN